MSFIIAPEVAMLRYLNRITNPETLQKRMRDYRRYVSLNPDGRAIPLSVAKGLIAYRDTLPGAKFETTDQVLAHDGFGPISLVQLIDSFRDGGEALRPGNIAD